MKGKMSVSSTTWTDLDVSIHTVNKLLEFGAALATDVLYRMQVIVAYPSVELTFINHPLDTV